MFENAYLDVVDDVEIPALVDVASAGDNDALDDFAAAVDTAVGAVAVGAAAERYCGYY